MANKFVNYFKSTLLKEATPLNPPVEAETVPSDSASPMDDATALAKTFQDDAQKQKLDSEIQNISLSPEQKADILRKADKYSDNITKIILPTLRKLHDDIVSGVFASIAPDIKGISGINEDLASLAESLRGRTRDAVLKSDKVEKK